MNFIRAAIAIPLMLAFGAVFNAGAIAVSALFGPAAFSEMIAYYAERIGWIIEHLGF